MFDAARKLRIGFALGCGEIAVEDGERRRYNMMALIGDDGEWISRYRKMHLPGSEEP